MASPNFITLLNL